MKSYQIVIDSFIIPHRKQMLLESLKTNEEICQIFSLPKQQGKIQVLGVLKSHPQGNYQ